MLLITRRAGEKIMIGDDVVVHIKEIVGNTVRVGIEAPRSHADLPRGDLARRARREPGGRRGAVRASVRPAVRVIGFRAAPLARRDNGYGLGMDFAKTARNLAVADVALAFARDRLAAQLPGVQPRKRRPGKKALLLGGVAAAAAAAVLLKRDKVTALLPGALRRARSARAGLHAAARLQLRRLRSGGEHRDPRAGAAGL